MTLTSESLTALELVLSESRLRTHRSYSNDASLSPDYQARATRRFVNHGFVRNGSPLSRNSDRSTSHELRLSIRKLNGRSSYR